jgi:hypothetical protein
VVPTTASNPGVSARSDDGYTHEHRPLAGYAALTASSTAAFVAGLLAAKRARGDLPERFGPWDLVLVGTATHKISRTITKEKVTSWIRAPFVRYQEPAGFGELDEQPRGQGLQLAVGELLVCPYCLGHWVASAFGVGMVGAPRVSRLIAFIFTVETLADFLQLAYKKTIDEVGA